jgi:hypothetical protein
LSTYYSVQVLNPAIHENSSIDAEPFVINHKRTSVFVLTGIAKAISHSFKGYFSLLLSALSSLIDFIAFSLVNFTIGIVGSFTYCS